MIDTGRSKFIKYQWLLNILYSLSLIFPKKSLEYSWRLLDLCPGIVGVGFRYIIIKRLTSKCGHNIYVGPFVEVKNWGNIEIGDNVSIHNNCYIDGYGGLTIGDNTSIAHNSSILTFEHSWSNSDIPIKYNALTKSQVLIEEDVWVGCGVRILAGSNIETRSIVAAGAVINSKVESQTIVGGVPAKKIKDISDG
ncbi:acyltransferase [Halobacillus salinarum]|uniref:Acyltransferase n=1 Tax=Halobacillus salinarum TaxID=2932257 RepID=A0ABY4EN35_9BACI|nr:acyltransferase [Halobacillus salinarum]UOQ45395.1 acyltransferase [Halobacillus salinarum]